MKNEASFSWDRFREAPVIGILRGLPVDTVHFVTKAFAEAGLSTLEITMNTEGAAGMINTLRSEFPGLNIGAGTVCNMTGLHEALAAGAQFIVMPVLDEAVIKWCADRQVPVFPGAFSPTEIFQAWSWGASAVKVFPATQLGPQYIKDVLAPLNDIRLIPTGGVTKDNIKAYFEAGAVGVGMGSSLLPGEMIRKGHFEELRQHLTSIKRLLP